MFFGKYFTALSNMTLHGAKEEPQVSNCCVRVRPVVLVSALTVVTLQYVHECWLRFMKTSLNKFNEDEELKKTE